MGRYALIIVLGFIVIFGYMSIRANRIGQRAELNSTKFTEKIMARQIAHSAAEYLLSLHSLHGMVDTTITRNNWLGGSFTGTITTTSYDSASMVSQISITVTATVGEESHTTTVTLNSCNLLIPIIPAAIGLFAERVSLSMAGNARIYGTDTNIDGSAGPSDALPAITVSEEDDSVALKTQYASSTKLQGQGGSPSIAVFDETDRDALQRLAEAYISIADYHLSSCAGFTGNVTLGSVASPVIVHVAGNCSIAGNLTGYGVLVAEGIAFTGTVKWYGIVLVTNDADGSASGNGNAKIYGALLIGASSATLSYKGNDRVYYSSEAIQIVGDHITSSGYNLKRVSTLSWWD